MIANAFILITTVVVKDIKTKDCKFTREKLKFGIRKPFTKKSQWMGDINDGVSHFLCPDHPTWLPNQRYDITLEEKRQIQKEIADDWRKGLQDGTYMNKADIAKQNGCSRAWVTRLLNKEF